MFDSFDEIPGILDADETSKLLDLVSNILVSYLRAHPDARGVIASRHYRRPRLGQEKYAQLEIRPFADRQIAQAVDQGTSRAADLKRILFAERPELGSIARNPLTLSLILLFWESKRKAPPNQSELFAAYIKQSLSDAEEIARSPDPSIWTSQACCMPCQRSLGQCSSRPAMGWR